MPRSESKPAASASEPFVKTSTAVSDLAIASCVVRSDSARGDGPHLSEGIAAQVIAGAGSDAPGRAWRTPAATD
jgi:hypothetical protein